MEHQPERSSLEEEDKNDSFPSVTVSKDFEDENKFSFRRKRLNNLEDCKELPPLPKIDISKLEAVSFAFIHDFWAKL